MKKSLIAWLIVPLCLIQSPAFSMPNPASVYCENHGGRSELGILSSRGICVFRDKSYCGEWSYLRGVCKRSQFYLPEKRRGTHYCFAQLPNKNLIIYLCKAEKK
ncbi:DUF333 domain-containing protein [Rickettsiella grylli]|uniref:DUF333 domain-containing protein n=1 Tax=Rickettsiella grylli TaxID=59196 RepID=A8PQ91_9COXI|nr:DUF333 domain-containing protein [Rickettsiella grylli]EDP46382.1 hypothetical protein RICGR_1452 [Rickettsiella grylli]